MSFTKKVKIRSFEKGFLFKDGDFKRILDKGTYLLFSITQRKKIDITSMRDPWIANEALDTIAASGALENDAVILDLADFQRALVWIDGRFHSVIGPGLYALWTKIHSVRTEIVSMRDPWITHEALDIIAASGALENDAVIIDLMDSQRALVWIDGRFDSVIGPGLYALWTKIRRVRTEIIDVNDVRFRHVDLDTIAMSTSAAKMFNIVPVAEGYQGVYFKDGQYIETLEPGRYFFWWGFGEVKIYQVDMREGVLDISGQEIITADKVTLRMNTIVTYRVVDAYRAVSASDDHKQALYREAQLALRAVVGTYSLDSLLTQKEAVAGDLEKAIMARAAAMGLQIISLGIRDVILPGDMKNLMNKVIEAKKVADANLIMRREETAAMRSQANTAKILENNPTLMRMRELDVLEKITSSTRMSVILGEKGLSERVINLL